MVGVRGLVGVGRATALCVDGDGGGGGDDECGESDSQVWWR